MSLNLGIETVYNATCKSSIDNSLETVIATFNNKTDHINIDK